MDDEKIKRLLEIVAEQLQSDKDNLTAAVNIVVDFSIDNSISPEILLSFVPSFGSNGFYEAAYALSEAAASLSIGHTQANAYFNAGTALTFMGRTDEAEAQYKLALAADPNHVATHSNYGLLLQESGHTEGAEAQYNLALAADPNHVATHSNYGLFLQESGRTEKAEAHYKLALAADPNHVATHYNYGNLLQQIGSTEKAEAQYKLVLAADPNHVATHSNYGLLLQQIGRTDEAEAQYKLVLAADPNDGATHSNYGILLQQIGRTDEAEAQYKLVLAADPNNGATHSNYGILLQESGRTDEAEAQYKLALAADPNLANSHSAYSLLLFINGDTKKALEQMKIASQLFKEKGDKVMEHLAMAWLFERYTEKYYKKGCLRNANKKKSKGNFKKSGIYARLAGNEYINAAEYAGEKAREPSLTHGYTLLGRSEIRKLELSFSEGIRLRLQHLHSYDIAKFERIMDGVKNASNYYKKAAEYSPERDPQCDACSKSMTTLSSILDFMLAIIHQRGVPEAIPKLDDKINDWHQQLSDAEMVYKVHKKSEKGEHFVNSLRKLIDCLVNLEKYQNSTMHEYKKALKDCMTELKEVAKNIEGPLHEIIVDSTKRMEKCALKQGLYTCGISDKSMEDQSFFNKKLRWIINHPIKSAIGFIVAVLASYIANNLDKIRLFFNNFINF